MTVYRSGSRKGRREGKKEGLAGEGRGNERAGERERECVFHVPNHISKSECRTNEINDYEKMQISTNTQICISHSPKINKYTRCVRMCLCMCVCARTRVHIYISL